MATELEQIRLEINDIDTQIINLLAQRRNIAKRVAAYKITHDKPVKDKQREALLLDRLINQAQNLDLNLPVDLLAAVYQNIITDSCNYQQELILQHHNTYELDKKPTVKLSYLGLLGNYTYIAGKKFAQFIDKQPELVGFNNPQQVLNQLTSKQADFAILPLENSYAGSNNQIYDLLSTTSAEIVADINIDEQYAFCAKTIFTEKDINVIYADPVAYEQCRQHILELQPHAKVEFTESLAHAMNLCKQDANEFAVALGNLTAAKLYGLCDISGDIANHSHNQSRFIVIANRELQYTSPLTYKTMIQIIVDQHHGALLQSLKILDHYQLNITKLKNRQLPQSPWQEIFFIEFEGHTKQIQVQKALQELNHISRGIKIIGSFPSFTITNDLIASE